MPGSRIFVLRSDRLGDVILSSGYLASLAESFPDHDVELWLAPDTAVCSQVLHPGITVRKLPFDRFLTSGTAAVMEWLETVQADNYAFTVIPQFTLGYPEIIALGYLGLGTRWGFLNRQLGVRPEWIYRELGPPRAPEADWIGLGPAVEPFLHEVEKYRLLARQQKLQRANVKPRLSGLSKHADNPGLLIWPGSGDERRRWPADRFAAVAKSSAPVKITIGAVQSDRGPADQLLGFLVESGIPTEICLRDPEDLRGTAEWLAGFGRVLTNDTGIAHLASAAGVEVIAVSGSQHQGRFSVFGRKALTIFADVPCRRCGGMCIFGNVPYPCVTEISLESVSALVQQNQSGNQFLPPSPAFFAPDLLFPSLIEARQANAEATQARLLDFDQALRAARHQLGEAEQQRDTWTIHFREAERQRDESLELLRAADAQKQHWENLFHEAEQQRDGWTTQFREAAHQRDQYLELLRAAEARKQHWEDLFHQAEQQRDGWTTQFREAELQRDEYFELLRATEAQKQHWENLFHQAEHQRDAATAQRLEAESQREESIQWQRAAEAQKQNWEDLFHQAEQQRDASAIQLREAERQRDESVKWQHAAEAQKQSWEDLFHQAERQRDTSATQLREAERQRDESIEWQRAAEAQRQHWEDLFHQAEQQRDASATQLREAERQRGESIEWQRAAEAQRQHWEDLFHQAEGQRDASATQLREAERQRDESIEWQRAAEAQRQHWEDLFRQAEQQRDAWAIQYQEAERQRNDWEALFHTAESQREDWSARYQADHSRLERIGALYPWMLHAANTADSVPRISIITPSFQSGEFIEQTIQSILDQGYPNFEHIVMDGGSTDQTIEILKRFPHVRWVSEPDHGQAHAINKGLMIATGDIVAYLNADDVYRPGAFSEVSRFFETNPAARIVVGDCDFIDGQSNIIGHVLAKFNRQEDLIAYWGWDKWYCIPQQSVFWRRDLLADTGLFDVSLHMVMDYDMWLRVAGLTHIHVLHQTLGAFRLTPDTKTGGSTHLMYHEEFRTSRKYWRKLPFGRRLKISFEARRHLSSKLLNVAEHFSLNDLQPGTIPSLVKDSVRHWPISAFYPRMIFTAGEIVTGKSRLQRIIKIAHRKYLGLKWRMQQRRRGER